MNRKIKKLLRDQGGNYILPFFWQHGETEEVLREYMQVIHDSNIGAVCIESRPHPDFCGPGWWRDMDIILDEARKRGMKVWILDDSHFPTGYANGALKDAEENLCRQSLTYRKVEGIRGGTIFKMDCGEYKTCEDWQPNMLESYIMGPLDRIYTDDELIGITAVRCGGGNPDEDIISLTGDEEKPDLEWQVPEGKWNLYFCYLTRNRGFHRDYINMMDKESCRILIDTVYEAHYEHYADDFGQTIAGFFSDEPELGNGHMFEMGKDVYETEDQAWSREVTEALKERWGTEYKKYLPLLWEQDFSAEARAKVRFDYMDTVTRLVETDFSWQTGDWCRSHDVEYIGHVIEDNNQHGRTGSSLGHYFRGLAGQDMSGIDDIGGQVHPQGEHQEEGTWTGGKRDGYFYHYALAKLGASAAALQPWKKGRAMCEIFGNYGWAEGVRLEKYLIDHFMVRGINYYVPHAFSPKEFPDSDCPPHFYAHGHNPQYRHFGKLMQYTNRVCELISDGVHTAPAAILYHAESGWSGRYMYMQEPAMYLADRQIDYDFVPADVFENKALYGTDITGTMKINRQEYRTLIIPESQFITKAAAESAAKLADQGFPVFFINRLPEGCCEGDVNVGGLLENCRITTLEKLTEELDLLQIPEVSIAPQDNRIRYYHYQNPEDIYYFVNEGEQVYKGVIEVLQKGTCYHYHAWENRLEEVRAEETEKGTMLYVELEPLKSLIVVFDNSEIPLEKPIEWLLEEITQDTGMPEENRQVTEKVEESSQKLTMQEEAEGWIRSICESIAYPAFKQKKAISLPDSLAVELPEFSGFIRYEKQMKFTGKEAHVILEITDAYEGIEVFVNGISAGIQIVPSYRYDITSLVHGGENEIVIEAATTLERAMSKVPGRMDAMLGNKKKEPSVPSGINGIVRIWS